MLHRRLICVTVALLCTPAMTAPSHAARCAGAELAPTAENLPAVRTAIRCLQNEIRARHRLPRLKMNSRLRRAATRHSADMVAAGYFEHTSPSGARLIDRLRSARYLRRGQDYVAGENLAWGTGTRARPARIVNAWMRSPAHSVNIMRRTYRDFGIGIAIGVPRNHAIGATYTADFGAHR